MGNAWMIDKKEKTVKKTVVCDGCGKVIEHSGSMCSAPDNDEEMLYFCDECSTPANQEFRICIHCGMPMIDGMTDLDRFYTHTECFEAEMNRIWGEGLWHETEEAGVDDGFYEAYDSYEEAYFDTGIFYTEWY